MIQCPESGTMASWTSLAAKRVTVAIIVPNDFSPPTASTGMVSFESAKFRGEILSDTAHCATLTL